MKDLALPGLATVTRRLAACAALLAVVVLVPACAKTPKPAGPLVAIDWALTGKDLYDAFDQPTHSAVPLLCELLSITPATVEVVGSLGASSRDIRHLTKGSPKSIPFLSDDDFEDARHAQCHWSPLTTPDHSRISVEVTAYQKTPATSHARDAFAGLITYGKYPGLGGKKGLPRDQKFTLKSVALGSAACIGASAKAYFGVLRKDNVLMAVTISTPEPIPAEWQQTIPTSPIYAVLSVLNEQFGGGTGAPEQAPDKEDDCS